MNKIIEFNRLDLEVTCFDKNKGADLVCHIKDKPDLLMELKFSIKDNVVHISLAQIITADIALICINGDDKTIYLIDNLPQFALNHSKKNKKFKKGDTMSVTINEGDTRFRKLTIEELVKIIKEELMTDTKIQERNNSRNEFTTTRT